MIQYSIKKILERSKEPGYFPNHYDILGISRFGKYDPSHKLKRIKENRNEILDKVDQTNMQKLILEADKVLKNEALKEQYDPKLQVYLDKTENNTELAASYGMPRLEIEAYDLDGKRLLFDEIKPNSRFSRSLKILNAAQTGTLNATVTVPRNAKWLSISANRITQNDLHKPVDVIVDTSEQYFEGTNSRSADLEFSYQTDKGTKKYVLSIQVTLEGLAKKTQRILRTSNTAFIAVYAILILTLLNKGGFINSTFIPRTIAFFSIGYLWYILHNIRKAQTFRSFFEINKGSIIAGMALFVLLTSNFQAFFLFIIPVVVAFLLRYFSRKSLFPEFVSYVPIAGFVLFAITLFSSKDFRTGLFSSDPTSSSPQIENPVYENPKKHIVILKRDCNLRGQPSAQGNIIGLGVAGQKYEVIDYRPNSNWQKVNVGGKEGYIHITGDKGTIVLE